MYAASRAAGKSTGKQVWHMQLPRCRTPCLSVLFFNKRPALAAAPPSRNQSAM
jgi:hypothetical protein